jgi:hypothetical protein
MVKKPDPDRPMCGAASRFKSPGLAEILCARDPGHDGEHCGSNGVVELVWKSAEDIYGPEEKREDSSP